MSNIQRVSVKQFRAYENVEVIFTEQDGVVLMSGDNGSGKSTLLNAICWCLYADTPFYTVQDSDEIINKHAPKDAIVEVEVEAKIENSTYVFHRSANREARGGVLTVQFEKNGNWDKLDPVAGQDAVSKFLPKDIRHLFIFNGEQISGIFKADNEKGLKSSIYKISEIDIIDKTKKHLSSVEAELLKEIQKTSRNQNEIDKLRQARIICGDEILRKDEEIKILGTKIDASQVKFDELDEIAEKTASARETKALRDELVDELKQLHDELISLEENKSEILQQNYHTALLYDDFNDYVKILEQAESDSMLPPPIRPEVTEKILKSGMCICGRDIHEKEIEFIKKQHEQNESANELSYLTKAIFLKTNVDKALSDSLYLLSDTYKTIMEKDNRKDTLQDRISKFNDVLDKVNFEHDNPIARRNEIMREMEIQRNAKQRSVIEREQLKRDRDENESMLKKIISKDSNTRILENKRLFVAKILDQLGDIKSEMEESIREKLTKNVSDIFFSIFKDTVFSEVKIDEDYAVSLISDDGREYKTTHLGTGHAKTLGLSLAYGLSKDMGYDSTPMLIDNLYGDIKDTHFKEVTEMVEALSEKKQVIVMDLNVNKSLPLFKPQTVKQIFTINRIKEDHRTEIKEIDRA